MNRFLAIGIVLGVILVIGLGKYFWNKYERDGPLKAPEKEKEIDAITLNDIETAFDAIRRGATLKFVKELKVSEEVVYDTFRHLTWGENKPAITMWDVNKTIEAIKNDQEMLNLVSQGMEIQIRLMNAQGMIVPTANLMLRLSAAGIDIQKVPSLKMYSHEEFVKESIAFYENCKKTYSGLI